MPAKDGTGPDGQGARTWRSEGNYSGQGGVGNGRGAGRGGGRGMGGRGTGINASQDNSWLQTQIRDLQAAVEKLTERLGKRDEVDK